jgi:hypothetical protein
MANEEYPTDPNLEAPDPWLILKAMRKIDMSERAQHLTPWMDLVATRPPTERDALTEAGKEIWRYRIATIREHLDDFDRSNRGSSITIASLAPPLLEGKLAEMVYRPGKNPPVGFLVHDLNRPDDAPVWADHLETPGKTYSPPTDRLLDKQAVYCPSGIEEFGTDWQLFQQISNYVNRYLQLDSMSFRTLACIWAMMTWVFDRFQAVPYLRAIGDFDSGKTRLLTVFWRICYRSIFVGGAVTPSPIFRLIDRVRGTLIMDEADFGESDHSHHIVQILNQGYSRGSVVIRSERGVNDNFEVGAYDCFCPKLLGTRRRFSDPALESRCLTHIMTLQNLRLDMPLSLGDDFEQEAASIRNKLLLWRFRRWAHIKADPYARIEGIASRVSQIFQPLLACATDRKLQPTILAMVRAFSDEVQAERRDSTEGTIVGALIEAWREVQYGDRVPLRRVTERLEVEHHLSAERVSAILRKTLGFQTRKIGGFAYVYDPRERLQTLAPHYGLSVDPPGVRSSTPPLASS